MEPHVKHVQVDNINHQKRVALHVQVKLQVVQHVQVMQILVQHVHHVIRDIICQVDHAHHVQIYIQVVVLVHQHHPVQYAVDHI